MTQAASHPAWLLALARRRRESAYALAAVGVALALYAAWRGYKYHWELAPLTLWTGALALVALGTAFWQFARRDDELSDADATRLMVLTVGGLVGLFTALLIGMVLPLAEWSSILAG